MAKVAKFCRVWNTISNLTGYYFDVLGNITI